MSDLVELFETSFFQIGLRMGLAVLVLGWLAVWATGRRRLLPTVGILIALGTFATLAILEEPVGVEAGGVLAIVVGVAAMRAFKASDLLVPLGAVPGSLWLAINTEVTELGWVRVVMVLLIPIAGYLTSDFEKRYSGLGLGVIFYGLAALGVFVAVPDTEWARVLIAVTVPAVFLAWPRVTSYLGTEGAYAAIATFVIVTARGGGPRPASIVGSLACLGLLLIEPVLIAFKPGVVKIMGRVKRNWAGAVVASLPQFVIVALCSRVAARFTNVVPSLIVTLAVLGVTVGVGVAAVSGEDGQKRTF